MTEITRTRHLETEPDQRRDRRPHPGRFSLVLSLSLAACLAVWAMVGGGWTGTDDGPAIVGLSVEPVSTGIVAEHVVDSKASAEDMTAQLKSAGIDAEVHTAPTSPQLVGTWVMQAYSDRRA